MRAVVQRVTRASVAVNGQTAAAIGPGLLVLLGIGPGDAEKTARALAGKLSRLRIFEDEAGKMNRSVGDIGGAVLIVSQFTLYGDARKGNRPSFTGAARPEQAEPLCGQVVAGLEAAGLETASGVFGAHMQVELINDGPVTLWLDTEG